MENKKVAIISFFLIINISCNRELPGLNKKLFSNTPVQSVAEAISNNDLRTLREILIKRNEMINFQESKYGNTVLMFAVANGKADAIEILLDNRADPNKQSPYDNSNAMTLAAEDYPQTCDTNIMHKLIKHNANVNVIQHINRIYENGMHTDIKITPLMTAAKNGCMNMVRCLVDNGANIDLYVYYQGYSAITTAIIADNLDIARYFIIEKKASIPKYCYIRALGKEEEKRMSITDLLIEKEYDKSDPNYKLKVEILNYLGGR